MSTALKLSDELIELAKKGDLLGVRVYKFKINKQEILLSYRVGDEQLWLIALGSHSPNLTAAPV